MEDLAQVPLALITLVDLDRGGPPIEGQCNPREVEVDKSVSTTASATEQHGELEGTVASSAGRGLAMKLVFDTHAAGLDVRVAHVAALLSLLNVLDPSSADEDKRRPPRLELSFGDTLQPFVGVLESVSTTYTAFLPDGTPVRAACRIKLTEVSRESSRRPPMAARYPARAADERSCTTSGQAGAIQEPGDRFGAAAYSERTVDPSRLRPSLAASNHSVRDHE